MIKQNKRARMAASLLLCVLLLLQLPLSVGAEKDSKIIVSMGDSFSSGEGIPPFYGQNVPLSAKVLDEDWISHRSQNSWPGQLTLPGVSGEMKDHRDENWYFVATSGAKTEHITGSFNKKFDRDGLSGSTNVTPQIAVFDRLREEGKQADYVTLSIGGNDARFSDVVIESIKSTFLVSPSLLTDKLNAVWNNFYKEGGIRDKLFKTYQDIAAAAGEQAKIIVVGYPTLMEADGKGLPFSKDAATQVNDSVRRFNDEIEAIVNACKASGMRICFVSVEDAFSGHEAYAATPYIRGVELFSQDQDLEEGKPSAYSMHPNEEGAKQYAACVQAKIDEIEKDGGASEWPTMTGSDEREVVLVLDASSSMNGTPIRETKEAAIKFVSTVLKEDASIATVLYDTDPMLVADFSQNETYLHNAIRNVNAGGSTNTEGGLAMAHEKLQKSDAKKKIIVLMSDGEPNIGKTGDELIAYADAIKEEGILIYTLGFFSSGSHSAQALMEKMASEGCHFEVDDAQNLVFFFGDIADQIRGEKYIYVRIACPVDVTVSYEGETLSSKGAEKYQRTDFGTLTFEENEEPAEEPDVDNRIKTLRLKDGVSYDIHIDGNGKGKMSYTIGFMNEDSEYSDLRKFENIRITKSTEIDTVAANASSTMLRVDQDGDGKYDQIYKAKENGKGKQVRYDTTIYILLAPVGLLLLIVLALIVKKKLKKKA
ncbi:MAG: VWA domain-containing protein [Ruminococcaceae bacterium]|nr:VWA domain-containing protein [Oscillospiraceae bacterium]